MPGWLLSLSLVLFVWLVVYLWVLALCRTAGRSPRRGGYVKPPASPMQRAATIRQQLEVDWGYSSSNPPPGGASVEWVGRRLLRDPSRLTGRGWSTLGTAAPGANGLQPTAADYRKWQYGTRPPRFGGWDVA